MTDSVAFDDDIDLTSWNTEPSPAHPHVTLLLGGSLLAVVMICVLPLFVVGEVRSGAPEIFLAAVALVVAAAGVGPFVSTRLQSPLYVGGALVVFDLLPLFVVLTLTDHTPARQWCSVILIPVLLTSATLNIRFYRAQLAAGGLVGFVVMLIDPPNAWEAVLTAFGYVFFIVICASLTRDYWAALHRRFEQLQLRSHTDELTGLLNRRGFVAQFPELRRRAIELGEPLGMVMIDIDHFSRINEVHGHTYGDDVLQRVCAAVSSQPALRDGLVARIGGEELVVVVPAAAEPIACSVRAAVTDAEVHPGLTLSMGISDSDPIHCVGVDALWRLVDQTDGAMYRAKDLGRDRIVRVAPEDSSPGSRTGGDRWPIPAPRLLNPAGDGGPEPTAFGGEQRSESTVAADEPTDHRLFGAYCLVFMLIGAVAFAVPVAINRTSLWAPSYLAALLLMGLLGAVVFRQGRRAHPVTTTTTVLVLEACTICAVLATENLEHRLMIICVITVPVLVAAQSMPRWWLVSQYVLVFVGVGLAAYDPHRPLDAGWAQRTISLAVVISAAPAVLFWLRRRRTLTNARLRMLSATDPLTGVRNRPGLEQVLTEQHRSLMLQVLSINIDGFKAVNDTRGHVYGDQALVYLSGSLARQVADFARSDRVARNRGPRRPPRAFTPVVARTGGDRFVLIDESPADPVLIRRVRRAATALPIPLSVSFGEAAGPVATVAQLWTLVAAADADLARTKSQR